MLQLAAPDDSASWIFGGTVGPGDPLHFLLRFTIGLILFQFFPSLLILIPCALGAWAWPGPAELRRRTLRKSARAYLNDDYRHQKSQRKSGVKIYELDHLPVHNEQLREFLDPSHPAHLPKSPRFGLRHQTLVTTAWCSGPTG